MKYVEASRFGGPEVLAVIEEETPKPGEGMLLVEVQAAGINYADVLAAPRLIIKQAAAIGELPHDVRR